MHWPVLPRGCRSRHSPAIRSNLCRSTLRPPKGCRGFAHLGFRRDRSKMNSKRYSGQANEELRNGDHADRSGMLTRSFMGKKLIQLLAIVAVALYLVPTGAHLFELPHKMRLSPAEYMTVQQIYAGWQLFGIAITVALLTTLVNTVLVRADRRAFAWSLTAFLALAATQSVFWAFTYPVNVATRFWTVSPEPFETARRQWEYSHAASAMLTFVALVAIVFSSLTYRTKEDRRTS